MTPEKFQELYMQKGHAIQTGIAYEQGHEKKTQDQAATNKHLRVGIDTAKIELGALSALLMRKGIIQEGDFFESVLAFMDAEIEMRETTLSERLGTKVTLK